MSVTYRYTITGREDIVQFDWLLVLRIDITLTVKEDPTIPVPKDYIGRKVEDIPLLHNYYFLKPA